MYYVYVLKSEKDDKLYIGYTNDLKQRLAEHNSGKSFATAWRIPLSLIYYEAFCSKYDAIEREQQLKKFKSAYGFLKRRIVKSLLETQKVGVKKI